MSDTGQVPRLFPGFTESVVAVNGTTLFVRHGHRGVRAISRRLVA